jgi:predicted signal transduction protein with EAL and GGDEF domain
MNENEESAAIVTAITSLGASLRLPVTAEGIESVAISNSLQELGCTQGQGWHYGRPLPATEAKRLVESRIRSVEVANAMRTVRSGKGVAIEDQERRDHHRRGRGKRAVG